MTPPGYSILGDSAFFNDSRAVSGKIFRRRKANETKNIPESLEFSAIDQVLQKVMLS